MQNRRTSTHNHHALTIKWPKHPLPKVAPCISKERWSWWAASLAGSSYRGGSVFLINFWECLILSCPPPPQKKINFFWPFRIARIGWTLSLSPYHFFPPQPRFTYAHMYDGLLLTPPCTTMLLLACRLAKRSQRRRWGPQNHIILSLFLIPAILRLFLHNPAVVSFPYAVGIVVTDRTVTIWPPSLRLLPTLPIVGLHPHSSGGAPTALLPAHCRRTPPVQPMSKPIALKVLQHTNKKT